MTNEQLLLSAVFMAILVLGILPAILWAALMLYHREFLIPCFTIFNRQQEPPAQPTIKIIERKPKEEKKIEPLPRERVESLWEELQSRG